MLWQLGISLQIQLPKQAKMQSNCSAMHAMQTAVLVDLQVVLAKSEQGMHSQTGVLYQAMTNLSSVCTPKGMSYVSERRSHSKHTQPQVAGSPFIRS